MSRNTTTGVYTAPSNSWNPAVDGTVISTADWASTLADMSTALNHADATTRALYPTTGQVQDGDLTWAGTTAGSATAITATMAPAVTEYVTGMQVNAKIGTSCGASPTLNVNSVGAKKVYVVTAGGVAQASTGDLIAGDLATFRYDSALDSAAGGWVIVSAPASGWRTLGITTASAVAQVDFALPAAYRAFQLRVIGATGDASRQMYIRFSTNGGSSYVTGTAYIQLAVIVESTGSAVSGTATSNAALGQIANFVSNASGGSLDATVDIAPGTASLGATWRSSFVTADSSTWYTGTFSGVCAAGATVNAVRIFTGGSGSAAGSFSGVVELLGLR